jgi:hypothetical protein
VVTSDGNTGNTNAEFATYDPVTGLRQLNGVQQRLTLPGAGATDNVRINANPLSAISGTQTINSLTMNGAAVTISFAATGTNTLSLASGGLISGTDAAARIIGATTNASTRGQLTTVGSELFLHSGSTSGLTIHSDITGTFALVMDSMSTTAGALITLNNTNSYVGTAYANGVIVNLGAAPVASTNFVPVTTTNAITGNLIITGGTTGAASGGIATLVSLSTPTTRSRMLRMSPSAAVPNSTSTASTTPSPA